MIVLRKHKWPSSTYPICPSCTTPLLLAGSVLAGPGPALILLHLRSPSCTIGLWRLLTSVRFPHPLLFPPRCAAKWSFNSSFLLLSLLLGKDQGCKWLLSAMGLSMANPELHCLCGGDIALMLTYPGLHWWPLTSPTTAEQFSSRTWYWGELPNFHTWGEDSCPMLVAWSTEMCRPALRPAAWGAQQLEDASWCQWLLSADQRVAKGSFLLQLLAASSSPSFITHRAMLCSFSNYKAKWLQKPWTEIELWKSQQLDVRGQPA